MDAEQNQNPQAPAQPEAPAQPSLFDHRDPETHSPSVASMDDFRKLLRPTDHLPAGAECYLRMKRRAADPLGMAGLPATRAELDDLVVRLCQRLWSAGTMKIPGDKLAAELGLHDTRALRELTAYAHVHHRIRAVVGVPGSGYCWGANDPDVYEIMARQTMQMLRCFGFLSTLYGKGTPAVEACQLIFNFVEDAGGDATNPDPLGILMRAEGVRVEDVLSAIISKLSETPDGRRSLQVIGERHSQVLVSTTVLANAEQAMQTALSALQSARRHAG